MAARRTRPRWRGIRGSKRVKRWTAQISDRETVANNSTRAITIVGVSDYASNTNLEPQGVTLVRLRGYLSFVPSLATQHTIFAALVVIDQDQTAPDPSSFQDMIDERVLWWWSGPGSTASGQEQSPAGGPICLDIKAKARLRDSNVSLVTRSTGGAAGNTDIQILTVRALLVGEAT